MTKFLIRNDDVAYDTDIAELKTFCEICDRYGFKIIQAITLIGECRKARVFMDNRAIKRSSFKKFQENQEVVQYLLTRDDFIAVHGLWHTHAPTIPEIKTGKRILEKLGFVPTYFAPPFNEGNYPKTVAGLTALDLHYEHRDSLERYLKGGIPNSPIMYLHSWRFNNVNYTFDQLEQCLAGLTTRVEKLTTEPASASRIWYNDWVTEHATGNVLDIGKSRYWNYHFKTLDTNSELTPTYVGDAQHMAFADNSFDTVLCNGMYEFVEHPQKMIDEVLRVTKPGGTAIFGFVGRAYKPYKKDWNYYEGKEQIPPHERVDFGQEYHFLICKK